MLKWCDPTSTDEAQVLIQVEQFLVDVTHHPPLLTFARIGSR